MSKAAPWYYSVIAALICLFVLESSLGGWVSIAAAAAVYVCMLTRDFVPA